MVNRKAESAQIKEINDFRKKTLNLPNRKAGIYAFTRSGEEIPTVYPVSPLLFPEVDSWNGHVVLPGFFFLHSEKQPRLRSGSLSLWREKADCRYLQQYAAKKSRCIYP